MSLVSRGTYGQCLAGILLAGSALRAFMARAYLVGNPFAATPVNDAEVYWDWAGRIARGELVLDGRPFFSAPLYPYLLGALRALGASLQTVVVLQVVASVGTAWLLSRVVRARFGDRASLLAAALFLVLLEPASSSLRILASTVHLVFVVLVYAAMVAFQESPGPARAVGVGSALGLLVLSYAPAILLIPILGAWAWWGVASSERRRTSACLLVAVAGLFVLPATLHNWKAVGELVPLQSGSGMTLLQGNQERSRGGYTSVEGISQHRDRMHEDAARLYLRDVGVPGSWNEVDRHFRNRALGFWFGSPSAALVLEARKLAYWLTSKNYAEIYAPLSEIRLGIQRSLLVAPVPTPWIMGLSLLGLAGLLRRPRLHAPELLLTALPLLVVLIFFYSPRYRLPAVPLLVTAAALCVDRALAGGKGAASRAAALFALVLGIASGPSNRALGFDRPMDAVQAQNLAFVLSEQGDPGGAAHWQQRGIDLGSDGPTAFLDLGTYLRSAGREAEAVDAYVHSLSSEPFRVDFTMELASRLMGAGRFEEAAAILDVAHGAHPSDTQILGMLAVAQFQGGHLAAASESLRQAIGLAPDEPGLRRASANVLLQSRMWREALTQAEALLRLVPGDREAEALKQRALQGMAASAAP